MNLEYFENFETMDLTSPHNPESRLDEYLRIVQSGGKVIEVNNSLRVEGVLEVTRAIGDR